MAKFKVTYDHEVVITYEAVVEADSEKEAMAKMDDFDFLSEEEIEQQGIQIDIKDVQLAE